MWWCLLMDAIAPIYYKRPTRLIPGIRVVRDFQLMVSFYNGVYG